MKQITIAEYFKLKNTLEYDTILKHLKPCNKFAGGSINFNKLSYEHVIYCFELIKNINSKEKLSKLFKCAFQVDEFDKVAIDEFFSAKNYLLKAFLELKENQKNLLNSIDADAILWETAGGNRLDKFNNLMPLVQLGEIYSVFPYDLMKRPYNEIFTLLVLHKEKNEVLSQFSKLKNKVK